MLRPFRSSQLIPSVLSLFTLFGSVLALLKTIRFQTFKFFLLQPLGFLEFRHRLPPSPSSHRRRISAMDDSCAVCADSLEWVAYGSCGHREVCSTCVVRLRVVLGDRRCCICKTESPTVFVTKVSIDSLIFS